MGKSRADQPQQAWVAATASSMKGDSKLSSTARMMIGMCRNANHIPSNISDDDRDFRGVVIGEHRIARLRNEIESDPNLPRLVTNVQVSLDHLGANTRNPSAQQMKQLFDPQFQPLKIKADERKNQRDELLRDVNGLVKEKKNFFEKMMTTKNSSQSGRSSASVVKDLFTKFNSQLKNLISRKNQLVIEEKALEIELKSLGKEAFNAAKATGALPQTTETPKPPSFS